MMRKKSLIGLVLWVMVLSPVLTGAPEKIRLHIEKPLEIGRKDLMFASIASVCEDPDANVYVLDRMEHKVLKFSSTGELIRTFGQKGQGPGDFQNPHLLAIAPKGQLVVADEMYNLTFLSSEGNFIERVHLDGRLAVGFIGEDRYYAWIWGRENRSQVMIDGKNNILKNFYRVPISAFSVSAPDESGRLVLFNYSMSEFAPALLFAHSGRYSALGIGDKYDILILDEDGQTIARLNREIQPERFSKREKKYIEKEIEAYGEERGWPGSVIRDLVKKIPDRKIFFDQILMNEKIVLVFRIRLDISSKTAQVPVDIFTVKGEFLGTCRMPDKPLAISENHFYFVRSDEQANLFLEKAAFTVIENEPPVR
jgi:hypothetical protein